MKYYEYDDNSRVLHNVVLKNNDLQAEYDAIVLTKKGIFNIEVKYASGDVYINKEGFFGKENYDIPGKICEKETLLNELLGDAGSEKIYSILMFPNVNAGVFDNYKKIDICRGKGISWKIEEMQFDYDDLSIEEIDSIASKLEENDLKINKSLCPINCEELVDDFSFLYYQITEVIQNEKAKDLEKQELPTKDSSDINENIYKNIFCKTLLVLGGIAAVGISCVATIYTNKNLIKKVF